MRGDIEQGGSLPIEEDLAREFQASRTAVREAIKVLAGKGLVHSRTSAGTRVLDAGSWNLLDPDVLTWRYTQDASIKQLEELGELRIALEPEASRLAALHVTDTTLAAISEALDEMRASVKDVDAYIEADLRFHEAIVRASQNDLFVHINSMLSVAYTSVRPVHTRNVRRNKQTLPGHIRVLDAIRANDADVAAVEMRTLVEAARSDVQAAYSKRKHTHTSYC